MWTPAATRTSRSRWTRPRWHRGPTYTFSSITAPVCENSVPNPTSADRWHRASTAPRNARRRTIPVSPGNRASVCDAPSRARSRPRASAPSAYASRSGETRAVAAACTASLIAAFMVLRGPGPGGRGPGPDDLPDDVRRPPLHFQKDPPDVLADHAQADQLDRPEEEQD